MQTDLTGKKVLIITSNTGVEKSELLDPLEFLKKCNAAVTHAAIKEGKVQTEKGEVKDVVVTASHALSTVKAVHYDALVIPGGTVNADKLRIDENALRIVAEFAQAKKPIAAICHAPWVLIEAKLVNGRDMTSYHSIKTDLINAGAHWLDQAVVKSLKDDCLIITSRNPDDLKGFSQTIAHALKD